ncbi:hypothetical protein BX600DRAFT_431750 [Xylariales sp. PMI_506]|nr:hypothetical protein BX600DRAFT_431750 [Xylariales sp. PMI_506]
MSAARSVAIPELLHALGSQIPRATDQRTKCLVQPLHRQSPVSVDFYATPGQVFAISDKRQDLCGTGHLAHTRGLIVLRSAVRNIADKWKCSHPMDQRDRHVWHYDGLEAAYRHINEALAEVMQKAVRLQGFASEGLALSSDCIQALSSVETLEQVSICFPKDNDGFVNLFLDDPLLMSLPEHASRVPLFGRPELQCAFTSMRMRLGFGVWWHGRAELTDDVLNCSALEHIHVHNEFEEFATPWDLLAAEATLNLRDMSLHDMYVDLRPAIRVALDPGPNLRSLRCFRLHIWGADMDTNNISAYMSDLLAETEDRPSIPMIVLPILMLPSLTESLESNLQPLRGNQTIETLAFELWSCAEVSDLATVYDTLGSSGSLRYVWMYGDYYCHKMVVSDLGAVAAACQGCAISV